MDRPTAPPALPRSPAAPPPIAPPTAPLGPTGAPAVSRLDLAVESAHRNRPVIRRVSTITLAAATAVLAVLDALIWATDPVIDTGRLSISLAVLVPGLGAVAVGAVAWRLRRPAAALIALAAASLALTAVSVAVGTSLPPSLAAVFALAVLAATVLRVERGQRAVALTVLAGVAVAGEALRPQVAAAGYLLAIGVAAYAGAIGVGVYLRWSDWTRGAEARAARDAERLEIAHELHDLVGHHLTGIVVQANAARHVAGNHPDAAAEALDRISSEGAEALAALRWVVSALREQDRVGAGWDDIRRLADLAAAPGLPVTVSIAPDVPPLDDHQAPVAYRVVAESLTNARRHARTATTVAVAATRHDRDLVLEVHDDGTPAPQPTPTPGTGLAGLRRRVEGVGGSLEAGPAPEGGWRVRARLPLGADR